METKATINDKMQRTMQLLEEGVGAILDGESFKRYLRCMGRFHTYSANNIALILAQCPNASRVAGYRRWQQLGRQVMKGEKGLMILAPVTRKIEDEADDSTRVIAGFRAATVFDVSQTTGDALPEPPAAQAITRASDRGADLYRCLERWLTTEGVTIEIGDCGNAHGFYQPGASRIVLSHEIQGTDHLVKTLCHEAAHFIAGHRGYMPRDACECVAEGAAFVVCNRFGVDPASYTFPYISAWAQDAELFKSSLEGIRKTAHHIIAALETSQEEDECASACPEMDVETL